jgi:hypothetical protein
MIQKHSKYINVRNLVGNGLCEVELSPTSAQGATGRLENAFEIH